MKVRDKGSIPPLPRSELWLLLRFEGPCPGRLWVSSTGTGNGHARSGVVAGWAERPRGRWKLEWEKVEVACVDHQLRVERKILGVSRGVKN